MSITDILILGAGPCGLSTAIALAKTSSSASPLRITLVEVRPTLQTIGGTVNLTPLAMRYLDYLGAGSRLREKSISLDDGLDYISLRTGQRMGNIWAGIGARRIARHDLVQSILDTLVQEHSDTVQIQWGRRLTEISEADDKVVVKFEGAETPALFDVLLGCDGIHSSARRLYVEPERNKTFVNRVAVMGWNDDPAKGNRVAQPKTPPMRLPSGDPALRDTVLVNGSNGILLGSYYEPTRSKVYVVHISEMEEPQSGDRDGWKTLGDDKVAVRNRVLESYKGGKVEGLEKLVAECEDWHLYPIYVLPGEGRWYRGRVLLLGDASHAMPPQGESTGFAIEDGVLAAHVFQRRGDRPFKQLFSDLVAVRKPVMDREYRDAIWQMEHGFVRTSGFSSRLLEWGTSLFLLWKRWRQEDHFAGDVRNLELPA